MLRSVGFVLVIMAAMLPLHAAQAATLDSGQILREQPQPFQRTDRLPAEEAAEPVAPAPVSEAKFTVNGFRFSGIDGVASEAELQALVAPAVGKTLGFTELAALVDRVSDYLRDKGYLLAHAYLPRQEIVDGIVHIAVIAGKVEGAPNVLLPDSARISRDHLSAMAASGAPAGEPLRRENIERSLLLINDLPGVSARSILDRGSQPGTTRVTFEAQEGPLVDGAVSLDNFGNRYTGIFHASGYAAANDPTGHGDQFSVVLTGSEGLTVGRLRYELPLGVSGLKTDASYTTLRYKLRKEFGNLNAKGSADTYTATASYPLIRTRAFSLWQGVNYEHRSLEDKVGGLVTQKRGLNLGTATIRMRGFDRVGGGAISTLDAGFVYGDLKLGVAANAAADAVTARSAGRYAKVNVTASRLQRVAESISMYGAANIQYANHNLDSSEKFILGGPSGVRSFPVGEAAGDQGFSFTGEVRYQWPDTVFNGRMQLVGFIDAGRITLHKSPWNNAIVTATGRNQYWLTGVGAGVNLDISHRLSLRASYAVAASSNPGRSTTNLNVDNGASDQRFWLQGIAWF